MKLQIKFMISEVYLMRTRYYLLKHWIRKFTAKCQFPILSNKPEGSQSVVSTRRNSINIKAFTFRLLLQLSLSTYNSRTKTQEAFFHWKSAQMTH